jgi:glucuronosyltransferase
MEVKSKLFRDRPQSPIDTVVYWTEYVLRNDVSSLKPMNNHLTWYQRRLLDVYLGYGLVIFLSLTLVTYVLKKILKFIFSSNMEYKRIKTKTKLS